MIKKMIFLAGLVMLCMTCLPIGNVWADLKVGGHDITIGSGKEICENGGLTDDERKAAGCDVKEVDGAEASNVVQNIINTVIAVLGIVAVIFIVIGGAQLVLSQGEPAKVKKAKDTILYAVLGVILAAMAYAIVNFVLANLFKDEGNQGITSESSQDKNGCKEGQHYNAQTGECY